MKRISMLVLSAAVLVVATVGGQQPAAPLWEHDLQNPPMTAQHEKAPLTASLAQAESMVRASVGTTEDRRRALATKSIELRDDSKVRVEIFGPKGATLADEQLTPFGFEIAYSLVGAVEGWVPALELTNLAKSLPRGWEIHPCGYGLKKAAFEGTGPGLVGTTLYRDDGYDGTGIHIAVIDTQYVGLLDSVSSGDAPNPFWAYDYTGLGMFSGDSGDNHGRFVVETVYDHAPGAEYSIIRVGSQTQLLAAANALPGLGVDIVCMSLGWWPSWEDDSSTACDAANVAASNGILFLNSAGNSADQHYLGTFSDSDADEWHNFQGNDETLSVQVGAGNTISFYAIWDRAGDTHDYDAYIYDVTNTTILDSSEASGETYESVSWENDTGSTVTVNFALYRRSGSGTEISIHGGGTWLQYMVPARSYWTPSDASEPNALSIAAVESAFYGSANYTDGITAVYSSEGPTHDGSQCPDLAAPTSTNGSFFSSFIGTSCSAPHAAGMIAALWSVNPSGTASQVRSVVYDWASQIRDWGPAGTDSRYGWGGVSFPPYDDCNSNNFPDAFDIESGALTDNNGNWIPDVCELPGFKFGLQTPFKVNVPPQNGLSRFNAVASISALDGVTPAPSTFGFQMAIGYDTALLSPASVQLADPLLALIGSAPSFFNVSNLAGGTVVAVTYDTPPIGGPPPLTVDFAQQLDVLVLELETIPTAFSGSTMPAATVGFTDSLGIAGPLPNQVDVGSTSTATVHLDPPVALDFVSNAGFTCQVDNATEIFEQSDGAGTISTTVRYVEFQPNNNPSVVEGFAMTITNGLGLGVQSATVAPIIDNLNGGLGPDFLSIDLTNGTRVECVVGAGDSLSFLGSPPIVDLTFDLSSFLFSLPMPVFMQIPVEPTASDINGVPAVNHVTVGGTNYTPSFDEGFMTIGIVVPNSAPQFQRGDANGDGSTNVADAVFTLSYLFNGGAGDCLDAMDANDDGTVNIADPVAELSFLFSGGAQPPAPFPDCGADPTPDSSSLPIPGELGCDSSPACP